MSTLTYAAAQNGPQRRLLSEPLRDALKAGRQRFVVLGIFELADADGTVILGDPVDMEQGIPTEGPLYKAARPIVTGWGQIRTGVQVRGESLQTVSLNVQVSDSDRWWAKKIVGPYAHTLRNTPLTVYLGAAGVRWPDWHLAFRGSLQAWALDGPASWTLSFGPDDQWLKGFVPRHPITTADYRYSDAKTLDQYIPLIYGKHSTEGLGGGGALALPLVDSKAFRYLVGLGHITVDVVYVSGAPASTGWSVVRPTRGGKLVTEVAFTADQGTAEVRADVRGFDTAGDGTGDLIENPVDVLAHFVTNFGRGDWRSGSWGTDDPDLLDLNGLRPLRDYFTLYGVKNSRVIRTRERVSDIISSWGASNYAKPFWTHDGRLSAIPLDHRPVRRYLGDPWWVKGWADEQGGFRPAWEDSGVRDEIALDFMQVGDSTRQTLRVRLPDMEEYASENQTMDWSYGSI